METPNVSLSAFLGRMAQAAYAFFEDAAGSDAAALVEKGKGDFPTELEERFLGLNPSSSDAFQGGTVRIAYQPNSVDGFSATVFNVQGTGQKILSIRGTEGASDLLEDAKLGIVGFASDQTISLYRYYRQLITPGGQAVQYTAAERTLLHRLDVSVSALPGSGLINASLLDAALDQDVGVVRADGAAGSFVERASLGGARPNRVPR